MIVLEGSWQKKQTFLTSVRYWRNNTSSDAASHLTFMEITCEAQTTRQRQAAAAAARTFELCRPSAGLCAGVKVQIVIWGNVLVGLRGVGGEDEHEEEAGDTLLAWQFNHYIPGEVLTVVLWKLLKLLSKVKWNCSLSGQHWENKGICSWLLINVARDQHEGFIKLYITGVI